MSTANILSAKGRAAAAATSALAFVASQGVVLVSAKGPVPRLIDVIAGGPISGNWWSHPRASHIYNVVAEVCESERILVCRLINGKRTLVHDRLWPALVRIADQLPKEPLARVCEEHTKTGQHAVREVSFPKWVPDNVATQAALISERDAVGVLAPWLNLIMRAAADPT